MRLKAYVASRGVEFESINVAANPEALRELEPLGVRSFPLVLKGKRFVLGMDLDKVDELLGLKQGVAKVPAEDVARRLVRLVHAFIRFSRQIPPSTYDNVVPGLEGIDAFHLPSGEKFTLSDGRVYVPHGTYIRLIGHVLRHTRRVRLIIQDPTSEHFIDPRLHAQYGEPLPEDRLEDMLEDGQDIIRSIETWWAETAGRDADNVIIETFHGPRSQYQMLATEVYSLTQHTRQLMTLVSMLGMEPDGPLGDADYRDLNLPTDIWK